MAKENHLPQILLDRLQDWQRKLRRLTQLMPQRGLPLLTPAEPHGPDLQRFRDPSQALLSWSDKQLQRWQFTGHLATVAGNRTLGFQLAFFERHTQRDFIGFVPTRWMFRKAQPRAFAAHFSLVDPLHADAAKTYRWWQRGTLLIPGKGFAAEDRFHVEVGGWYARRRIDAAGRSPLTASSLEEAGAFSLYASGDDASLHLELQPERPLLYHGQSGYLQKASRPEQSSFYCGISRLRASGKLVLDGKLHEVEGTASLDHEKTAEDLESASGNDWISAQLDSGEELFLMIGRDGDGGERRFSSGSWIGTDGAVKHLISSEIQVENIEYWTSPATGARYPVKRRVRIEPLGLDLDFKAPTLHQEVVATRTAMLPYWAGTMEVRGSKQGQAFMELAGYGSRPIHRTVRFLTGP